MWALMYANVAVVEEEEEEPMEAGKTVARSVGGAHQGLGAARDHSGKILDDAGASFSDVAG